MVAKMRHENVFFRQGVLIAKAWIMALQKKHCAVGKADQGCRGERALSMPQNSFWNG